MSNPYILALAGVNGAGKSSIMGARTGDYFNPDEYAREVQNSRGCSIDEANAQAWEEGRQRLETAIRGRTAHVFETTLGGNTIPRMLQAAAKGGIDVLVWFVGLSSPELHLTRVRARVEAGGHDIPEQKIRERWDSSRRNIILLMPFLAELKVFDNSEEGDPATGIKPKPRLLLHWRGSRIVAPSLDAIAETPEWAKPIVMQALKLQRR